MKFRTTGNGNKAVLSDPEWDTLKDAAAIISTLGEHGDYSQCIHAAEILTSLRDFTLKATLSPADLAAMN